MPFRWNSETIRDLTRYALKRSAQDRLPQVAGSLTFTTVLSLVPILTVAFVLFTAFPIFENFREALEDWLFDSLIPENISDQILVYLNQFSSKAKGLTTFGLLGIGLTAVMTLFTVENALNAIWRVTRRRNLAQRVLVYWAILTVGPLLMGGSLAASSWLVSASAGYVNKISDGLSLVVTVVPVLLSALAFALLYLIVPNRQVAWRDAIVGGIVAALAFEFAKRGFGYFVAKFPTYTAVYGAFAAIPIFLLWIYVSWLVTLFGAAIAANLAVMRQGFWQHRDYAGAAFFDALSLLHVLFKTRETQQAGQALGLPESALSPYLGLDLPYLQALLEKLAALSLIAKLANEGADDRWVLVCDPATTTLACLHKPFLLDVARFHKTPMGRALGGADSPQTLALEAQFTLTTLQHMTLAQTFARES